MRLHFLRCRLGLHRFDDIDDYRRVWCSRCGKRKPKRFDTIPDPALAGRVLTRPKTRGQR